MSSDKVGSTSAHVNNFSVEHVTGWVKKMGDRGLYQPNSARHRAVAIERLASVLGEEEPHDAAWILQNVAELGRRYATKHDANPETTLAYMTRARGALEDFLLYQQDPTKFKGRQGAPRPKKQPEAEAATTKPIVEPVASTPVAPPPVQATVVSPAWSPSNIRSFPIGDADEFLFKLPTANRIGARDALKIACHLLTLAHDFDPLNPTQRELFALASNPELTH